MAASCTDTTTGNSLRVLKNLISLLRAGTAQLALATTWNGWSADILSTFLLQVNWKQKEVFSPSAPGCFRTPTGTMTVGGGELRAPEAWACCKGGIVEQYSAGLLGLGLWLEALIMFSQAWAKANKEQEPSTQRKVSNSPKHCVKFSAAVSMDPATSQSHHSLHVTAQEIAIKQEKHKEKLHWSCAIKILVHREVFSENTLWLEWPLVPHTSFCFFFKDLIENSQHVHKYIY